MPSLSNASYLILVRFVLVFLLITSISKVSTKNTIKILTFVKISIHHYEHKYYYNYYYKILYLTNFAYVVYLILTANCTLPIVVRRIIVINS